MCGVAFLRDPTKPAEDLQRSMAAALEALRHRGPDEGGAWANSGTVVGHRRLSIIDLRGSQQPMVDPSGRYVLSFNGEIYNYKSLRRALSSRWTFKTDGDTEVVLAALVLDGPEAFSSFDGMWALALWDEKSQELLLSRDRMGEKPLYYSDSDTSFACASELPALRHLVPSWLEDIDSTADYFRYGFYLPGTTAYKGIHEVLPGHYLQWRDGKRKEIRYWSLPTARFSGSRAEACEALRDAIERAVRSQLVADVEVGTFLSGGIDSSLITGIASRAGKIKTFTIGFDTASFDERPYARRLAEHFQTAHYDEQLRGLHRDQLLSLLNRHVGQPFIDSSLLPTYHVARLARDHVKVSLSGDGGDELFCGYQRYIARVIMRWYTRLPVRLRAIAERLLRALPEPALHHSASLIKKAHLFTDIAARHQGEMPYVAPLFYAPADYAALLPDVAHRGHRSSLPEVAAIDDLGDMLRSDATIYLPQDILTKVDRASMACSLETRAPFLSRDVVDLAFSFPIAWHRRGFQGKQMLRSAFREFLPADVWGRRKQGFAAPVHAWFRAGLEHDLHNLVARVPSPLSDSFVQRLLAEHSTGQRDHGYRLWGIYVYLTWRDNLSCLPS